MNCLCQTCLRLWVPWDVLRARLGCVGLFRTLPDAASSDGVMLCPHATTLQGQRLRCEQKRAAPPQEAGMSDVCVGQGQLQLLSRKPAPVRADGGDTSETQKHTTNSDHLTILRSQSQKPKSLPGHPQWSGHALDEVRAWPRDLLVDCTCARNRTILQSKEIVKTCSQRVTLSRLS